MLAFHSNVSNFKNILPKPRESVPGASRSKLAPAFMSPVQKSEWQTYVACLTLVSGESLPNRAAL